MRGGAARRREKQILRPIEEGRHDNTSFNPLRRLSRWTVAGQPWKQTDRILLERGITSSNLTSPPLKITHSTSMPNPTAPAVRRQATPAIGQRRPDLPRPPSTPAKERNPGHSHARGLRAHGRSPSRPPRTSATAAAATGWRS